MEAARIRGLGLSSARAFDEASRTYDAWYEEHLAELLSELKALRKLLRPGLRLDVGVGTGLVAQRLGVEVGVDLSLGMLRRALKRGIAVVKGVGEHLPFREACFDHVVTVATLCFLDDPAGAVKEAWRVVKPGGCFVACFISKESEWGKLYEARRSRGGIYACMRLLAPSEVMELLRKAGFKLGRVAATLSQPPGSGVVEEPSGEVEGRGFVCLEGLKET